MSKKDNITLTIAVSAALTTNSLMSPIINAPLIADEIVQHKQQAENQENRQIEAFESSKYTYDDAEVLASFWGLPSSWDAKLKIGSLILNRKNSEIDRALNKNKKALNEKTNQHRQIEAFGNSKYTYEDAEVLASFWGLPSTWDAKLKIGSLILNHKNSEVNRALRGARSH